MKHIIAKSFLFAKEGEEVRVAINNIYEPGIEREDNSLVLYIKSESELQQYIDEGWIVEKKPREIWVNEYRTVDHLNGKFGAINFSKEEAEDNLNKSSETFIRTIHFIEAE